MYFYRNMLLVVVNKRTWHVKVVHVTTIGSIPVRPYSSHNTVLCGEFWIQEILFIMPILGLAWYVMVTK